MGSDATIKGERTLNNITFRAFMRFRVCFHHSLQLTELKRMVYILVLSKMLSVLTLFSVLLQMRVQLIIVVDYRGVVGPIKGTLASSMVLGITMPTDKYF